MQDTRVGYTGGARPNPTYSSVCSGGGHTEALKIDFDPNEVSYDQLLDVFWVGRCKLLGWLKVKSAPPASTTLETASMKSPSVRLFQTPGFNWDPAGFKRWFQMSTRAPTSGTTTTRRFRW